jgi:hypothetical protein
MATTTQRKTGRRRRVSRQRVRDQNQQPAAPRSRRPRLLSVAESSRLTAEMLADF